MVQLAAQNSCMEATLKLVEGGAPWQLPKGQRTVDGTTCQADILCARLPKGLKVSQGTGMMQTCSADSLHGSPALLRQPSQSVPQALARAATLPSKAIVSIIMIIWVLPCVVLPLLHAQPSYVEGRFKIRTRQNQTRSEPDAEPGWPSLQQSCESGCEETTVALLNKMLQRAERQALAQTDEALRLFRKLKASMAEEAKATAVSGSSTSAGQACESQAAMAKTKPGKQPRLSSTRQSSGKHI